MMIEHDTASHELRAVCEKCYDVWLFDESEIVLQPWPHVECPTCGEWIPVF